jgi:lysophospholipase L1-like esterase
MKKIFLFLIIFLGGLLQSKAQKAVIDSSYIHAHYEKRMEIFNHLPKEKGGIVFLGNSITEQGFWNELLPRKVIHNRGIGGDNTFGVLARLDQIIDIKPEKIFLLIGINDIARGLPTATISNNIYRILSQLTDQLPHTSIIIQSVIPINENLLQADYLKNKKEKISELNKEIKKLASLFEIPYVDLHPLFANEAGELNKNFTNDGVHILPPGYLQWMELLKNENLINNY